MVVDWSRINQICEVLYFNYFTDFLKHIEVILIVISDGRHMHTYKSNVREFKSSQLHILVKLSVLHSFWIVPFNGKFLKIISLGVQSLAKGNMRCKKWELRDQKPSLRISYQHCKCTAWSRHIPVSADRQGLSYSNPMSHAASINSCI